MVCCSRRSDYRNGRPADTRPPRRAATQRRPVPRLLADVSATQRLEAGMTGVITPMPRPCSGSGSGELRGVRPRRPVTRPFARRSGMIGNREIAAADAIEKRELLEAWRAVANAKLAEFRRQCWRLSMLVRGGIVDKSAAVDRLYEIAIAHALVRALG